MDILIRREVLIAEKRFFPHVYLVSLGITESLLFHAQVTHFRHEFIRVDEETRAEQECEDVCPLWRNIKVSLKRSS